jgi:hypothetical protein
VSNDETRDIRLVYSFVFFEKETIGVSEVRDLMAVVEDGLRGQR